MRPLTLRQRLHPDGLVVREPVVLRLHPRVVDQRPRVGDQAAHRRTDVDVDLGDSRFSTARTEPCLVWRPVAVALGTLKQVMEEKISTENVELARVTEERGYHGATAEEVGAVLERL